MAVLNGKEGVWRTVGGRRIFIAEGEDLKTAMKNSGKFDNIIKKDIIDGKFYDSENDGKLTRSKMQEYINQIQDTVEYHINNDEEFKDYNEIEKTNIIHSVPDYENTLFSMRNYGYGLKDVKELEFRNERNIFGVVSTFNNNQKIYIMEITKY